MNWVPIWSVSDTCYPSLWKYSWRETGLTVHQGTQYTRKLPRGPDVSWTVGVYPGRQNLKTQKLTNTFHWEIWPFRGVRTVQRPNELCGIILLFVCRPRWDDWYRSMGRIHMYETFFLIMYWQKLTPSLSSVMSTSINPGCPSDPSDRFYRYLLTYIGN